MSWVDDLLSFGGDIVDMVGEVGSAYVTSANATKQEVNSQPETAQQREPIKGTNADGTPIVQTIGYPASPLSQQIINGVDNQTLMLVGFGLIAMYALRRG